jgi:hypothetical protein
MIEILRMGSPSRFFIPWLESRLKEENTSLPVQTLRELAMVAEMEKLTDIPQWWIQV